MKIEKLFIDKNCLVFKFENDFEYDSSLDDVHQKWWMNHMREKKWFTQELEDKVIEFLGKKKEDWNDGWLPRGSDEEECDELLSMQDMENRYFGRISRLLKEKIANFKK